MGTTVNKQSGSIAGDIIKRTGGLLKGAAGDYIIQATPTISSTTKAVATTGKEISTIFNTNTKSIKEKIKNFSMQQSMKDVLKWYMTAEDELGGFGDSDSSFESEMTFEIDTGDEDADSTSEIVVPDKSEIAGNKVAKSIVKSSQQEVQAQMISSANIVSAIETHSKIVASGMDTSNSLLKEILETLAKNTSTLIEVTNANGYNVGSGIKAETEKDGNSSVINKFDFNEYKKTVIANAKNSEIGMMGSMAASMFQMATTPGMNNAENLSKMGFGMLMDKVAPNMKSNLGAVDNAVNDIITSSLIRLGNKPSSQLGKIFGLKGNREEIDTSNKSLEIKGIPFDTVTKSYITGAIPGYLRQIVLQLGGPDMIYDPRSGKFTSKKAMAEDFRQAVSKTGTLNRAGSDTKAAMKNSDETGRMLYDLMLQDLGNKGTITTERTLQGFSNKSNVSKYIQDLTAGLGMSSEDDITSINDFANNMQKAMSGMGGHEILNQVARNNISRKKIGNQYIDEMHAYGIDTSDLKDTPEDERKAILERYEKDVSEGGGSKVDAVNHSGTATGLNYTNIALYEIYRRLEEGINVFVVKQKKKFPKIDGLKPPGGGGYNDKTINSPKDDFVADMIKGMKGGDDPKDPNDPNGRRRNDLYNNYKEDGTKEDLSLGSRITRWGGNRGKQLGSAIFSGSPDEVYQTFTDIAGDIAQVSGDGFKSAFTKVNDHYGNITGYLKHSLTGDEYTDTSTGEVIAANEGDSIVGKTKMILFGKDGVAAKDGFIGKSLGRMNAYVSEVMDMFNYGDSDDGEEPSMDRKRKKVIGGAIGALAGCGILAGPIGLVAGGIAGASLAVSGVGGKLKKFLFGDPDDEGNPGFVKKVFSPITGFVDKTFHNTGNFLKTNVFGPLSDVGYELHEGLHKKVEKAGGVVSDALFVSGSIIKNSFESVILGTKDDDGKRRGGIFSPIANAAVWAAEGVKKLPGIITDSFKHVFGDISKFILGVGKSAVDIGIQGAGAFGRGAANLVTGRTKNVTGIKDAYESTKGEKWYNKAGTFFNELERNGEYSDKRGDKGLGWATTGLTKIKKVSGMDGIKAELEERRNTREGTRTELDRRRKVHTNVRQRRRGRKNNIIDFDEALAQRDERIKGRDWIVKGFKKPDAKEEEPAYTEEGPPPEVEEQIELAEQQLDVAEQHLKLVERQFEERTETYDRLDELAQHGLKAGSIYTHDIHIEERLDKMLDMFSGMMSKSTTGGSVLSGGTPDVIDADFTVIDEPKMYDGGGQSSIIPASFTELLPASTPLLGSPAAGTTIKNDDKDSEKSAFANTLIPTSMTAASQGGLDDRDITDLESITRGADEGLSKAGMFTKFKGILSRNKDKVDDFKSAFSNGEESSSLNIFDTLGDLISNPLAKYAAAAMALLNADKISEWLIDLMPDGTFKNIAETLYKMIFGDDGDGSEGSGKQGILGYVLDDILDSETIEEGAGKVIEHGSIAAKTVTMAKGAATGLKSTISTGISNLINPAAKAVSDAPTVKWSPSNLVKNATSSISNSKAGKAVTSMATKATTAIKSTKIGSALNTASKTVSASKVGKVASATTSVAKTGVGKGLFGMLKGAMKAIAKPLFVLIDAAAGWFETGSKLGIAESDVTTGNKLASAAGSALTSGSDGLYYLFTECESNWDLLGNIVSIVAGSLTYAAAGKAIGFAAGAAAGAAGIGVVASAAGPVGTAAGTAGGGAAGGAAGAAIGGWIGLILGLIMTLVGDSAVSNAINTVFNGKGRGNTGRGNMFSNWWDGVKYAASYDWSSITADEHKYALGKTVDSIGDFFKESFNTAIESANMLTGVWKTFFGYITSVVNGDISTDEFLTKVDALYEKEYGSTGNGKGKGKSRVGRGSISSNVVGKGQAVVTSGGRGRGSSNPYYQSGYSEASHMNSSGCGPITAAIMANSYGSGISPLDAADMLDSDYSYRDSTGATSSDGIAAVGQAVGIPLQSGHLDIDEVADRLYDGEPLTMLGSSTNPNSPYTEGGHFVTATGMDNNGNVSVIDPLTDGESTYSIESMMDGMSDVTYNAGYGCGRGRGKSSNTGRGFKGRGQSYSSTAVSLDNEYDTSTPYEWFTSISEDVIGNTTGIMTSMDEAAEQYITKDAIWVKDGNKTIKDWMSTKMSSIYSWVTTDIMTLADTITQQAISNASKSLSDILSSSGTSTSTTSTTTTNANISGTITSSGNWFTNAFTKFFGKGRGNGVKSGRGRDVIKGRGKAKVGKGFKGRGQAVRGRGTELDKRREEYEFELQSDGLNTDYSDVEFDNWLRASGYNSDGSEFVSDYEKNKVVIDNVSDLNSLMDESKFIQTQDNNLNDSRAYENFISNNTSNYVFENGTSQINQTMAETNSYVSRKGPTEAKGNPLSQPYTIYSAYGNRVINGVSSWHGGTDLHGTDNSTCMVGSVWSGRVVDKVDNQPQNYLGNHSGNSSYGNYIIYETDDNHYVMNAHLKSNSMPVNIGDEIAPATTLGQMGTSGNSSGLHLHYEIRKGSNSYNNRINPEPYLDQDTVYGQFGTAESAEAAGSNTSQSDGLITSTDTGLFSELLTRLGNLAYQIVSRLGLEGLFGMTDSSGNISSSALSSTVSSEMIAAGFGNALMTSPVVMKTQAELYSMYTSAGGGCQPKEILDLQTMKTFTTTWHVRGAANNWYHTDVTPMTSADTDVIKEILKESGSNCNWSDTSAWSWLGRPGILKYDDDTMVAIGFHLRPHSYLMWTEYSNPGPPFVNSNSSGENNVWPMGGHFCMFYGDEATTSGAAITKTRCNEAAHLAYEMGNALYKEQQAAIAAGVSISSSNINGIADGDGYDAQVWNYLANKGLTDNAIAGIMGNLEAESGMHPGARYNDGYKSSTREAYIKDVDSRAAAGTLTASTFQSGTATGLAQWTNSRQVGLWNHTIGKNRSFGSVEGQMDHLWEEVNSSTDPFMAKLQPTIFDPNVSLVDAATAFVQHFERCGGNYSEIGVSRANKGKPYYDKYNAVNGTNTKAQSVSTSTLSAGSDISTESGLGGPIEDTVDDIEVGKGGESSTISNGRGMSRSELKAAQTEARQLFGSHDDGDENGGLGGPIDPIDEGDNTSVNSINKPGPLKIGNKTANKSTIIPGTSTSISNRSAYSPIETSSSRSFTGSYNTGRGDVIETGIKADTINIEPIMIEMLNYLKLIANNTGDSSLQLEALNGKDFIDSGLRSSIESLGQASRNNRSATIPKNASTTRSVKDIIRT